VNEGKAPSHYCSTIVKASEGLSLHAYLDAAGVWTIGWGHTGPEVVEGLQWTQEQADMQLAADLAIAFEQMAALVNVSLTQGQLDALTDFTFNMGAGSLRGSTLLKVLNMKLYAQVPPELYRVEPDGTQHGWIFGGGKVLPGLVARRKAEIELWNS
jgi:lysozyme